LLDLVQHGVGVALDYLAGSQLLVQAAQSQVEGDVSNVRGVDRETLLIFQDVLIKEWAVYFLPFESTVAIVIAPSRGEASSIHVVEVGLGREIKRGVVGVDYLVAVLSRINSGYITERVVKDLAKIPLGVGEVSE
jgi:hypothetical protein